MTFPDYKTMFEAWAIEQVDSNRMFLLLTPENYDRYKYSDLIQNTHAWEIAYLIVMTVQRKEACGESIVNIGMYAERFLDCLSNSSRAVVKMLAGCHTQHVGTFAEHVANELVTDKKMLSIVHMASCCVLGGTKQLLRAY